MKIVSEGYRHGFYYKPRIDKNVLRQYSEGIIALSACLGGEIASKISRGLYDQAKEAAASAANAAGSSAPGRPFRMEEIRVLLPHRD